MHLKKLILLTTLSVSHILFALPDDQYQSINIKADSATHDEKQSLSIYEGNVQIQQGSLKLSADKVTVDSRITDNPVLQALGSPASFEQQPAIGKAPITAQANNITYELQQSTVKLAGNAQLTQAESKISSDLITYFADKQVFKASKNNNNHKPERVEVIIPPRKIMKPTTER